MGAKATASRGRLQLAGIAVDATLVAVVDVVTLAVYVALTIGIGRDVWKESRAELLRRLHGRVGLNPLRLHGSLRVPIDVMEMVDWLDVIL